ncbi:homoserine O-acetyltransferase [Auricularia subglabra TFB-10046 SS5]|nr:homoserine O-acetyltransferase [Auricularia subglabra TFB-10046 SS5]
MSFATLVDAQSSHTVPSFELECGQTLTDVPVAYKTWGTLNAAKDNVMVICHAFTGSADVEDWWGPLIGVGRAFDPRRFFIFCANVLGSPYGTASPVTINPATGQPYGPDFPPTTIRDDVRLHKLVLDRLGVESVAVVIGGSMGGMATLEWPLCSPPGYVRHIIPLATSARHSAWCISWGEAQRQSIFSDPEYRDGWYAADAQPKSGLAAARMAALLTYRSRDSFESRFGRKHQNTPVPIVTPCAPRNPHHNDGLRSPSPPSNDRTNGVTNGIPTPKVFTAQSYLRYQGEKFNSRFDANCYVHITRKLDTHDVARGRSTADDESQALVDVLGQIPPGALVISIQTDGLFTPSEQRELAKHIPSAELVVIDSPDGHDGFLLEFEQINRHILAFLRKNFPELSSESEVEHEENEGSFATVKTSMFGEAEADVTMW